jgi:hypothetical protein
MAFYQNDDEDEQYGQGAQIGPQSGQVGVSSSLTPAHGDNSGSFVGIKNYLNANQTQGAKLGDQAANIINTSANDARNRVTGLSDKFNQAADQNTVNLDQDATNLAGTNAEKLNQDQTNTLKKQYNASYNGPQNITDFNDDYVNAQKAVNTAAGNVQMQGTEAGRIGLAKQINQQAGKQSRTSGGLDNLLLQAGGGKEKLQNAANANRDVVSSLTQAQDAATQKYNQAKATTDATKQATRSTIGQMDDPSTPEDESSGAFKNIKDYLSGKASAYDVNAMYRNALSDVGANPVKKGSNAPDGVFTKIGEAENPYSPNDIDANLLDQLGLQEGQSIYDVDLGNYIKQTPYGPTAQNMASADDVARYQALAGISGADPNWLTQAGSFNPLSIDKEGLGNALNESKTKFANDYSAAQKNLQDYLAKNDPILTNFLTGKGGDQNRYDSNYINSWLSHEQPKYDAMVKQIADLENLRDKRTVTRRQS